MNRLIFRKKRGTLGDPMVDFYSYLAFVFIILVFFVLLKFSESKMHEIIESDVENLDANNVALGYLRTPINFSNKETTIGDLIISLEQDIIKMKKEGKEHVKCEIDYRSMRKDNEKCDFLVNETRKMFESKGSLSAMYKKDPKKETYTFVQIIHLPKKDFEEFQKAQNLDAVIKKLPPSSKIDIDIKNPVAFIYDAECVGQRLILYNQKIDDSIIFRFCQRIFKK